EAALPVVGVFLRLEAELAKCALPLKAAGASRILQDHEIRVLRLVDRPAVEIVVAESEIQRQPVVHAPVVLDVETKLRVRNVCLGGAAVAGDRGDGAV